MEFVPLLIICSVHRRKVSGQQRDFYEVFDIKVWKIKGVLKHKEKSVQCLFANETSSCNYNVCACKMGMISREQTGI